MKFKSREDLVKSLDKEYIPKEHETWCIAGIDIALKSISERKKIYEKYKDNCPKFQYDFPEEYKDFSKKCASTNFKWTWEDWLYNLCFGDLK